MIPGIPDSIAPTTGATRGHGVLRIVIVGPGRAGGSIALAATASGHRVVGVLSRTGAEGLGTELSWDDPLPESDIALIAVKDSAISEVVGRLSGLVDAVSVIAHVSGFVTTDVLATLRSRRTAVGGFHPLQTLPDAKRGSRALASSYVGVGGDAPAMKLLGAFGESLGMVPFHLDDAARPAYHAAAAAASNFVVTALALAGDLFEAAGVDSKVGRPLAERVLANVFETDPDSALTGPIARGDLETVRGHLAAARGVSESAGEQYRLVAEATAIRAGRRKDIDAWR